MPGAREPADPTAGCFVDVDVWALELPEAPLAEDGGGADDCDPPVESTGAAVVVGGGEEGVVACGSLTTA